MKNLEELIDKFDSIPFLFVGSGISRRYYNLPSWKELLKIFIEKITDDEFAFSAYENKAREIVGENLNEIYPKMAELIEKDYNQKWFNNEDNIRCLNEYYSKKVKDENVSPFKSEIAQYISENSNIVSNYENEVKLLQDLSKRNIAGVITTNYDEFLEKIFDGYKTFVGQEDLLFSSIQEIGEIYKIHGTISEPSSIIINSNDYERFDNKCNYLVAKLMTIFVEHPIIFIGYSLNDKNIQNIISSIIDSVSEQKIALLKDRFIFVEYSSDMENNVEISNHTIKVENKFLEMKKIRLNDFSILYKELSKKKVKVPVRMLRFFKESFYRYIISNEPNNNVKVGNIDDVRIKDEELVLAIGKNAELALKGVVGVTANDWYRDIVLDDGKFDKDELLEFGAIKLLKSNSNRLPLNKYLAQTNKTYEELEKIANDNNFDNIINNSIKKNRQYVKDYSSVIEIWNNEKENIAKATHKIAHLTEKQINVEELERVLKEIFNLNKNILENGEDGKKLI